MSDVFAPSEYPHFVTPPDDSYICPKCSRFLRPPVVQTKLCGHRLCTICWEAMFQQGRERVNCPESGDCTQVLTNAHCTKDRSASNELKRMQIYCMNRHLGCVFTDQWIRMFAHEASCEYSTL